MAKGMAALVLGALLLAGGAGTHAAIISVDALAGGGIDASGEVTAGTSFSVDVLLSEVTDLAGFQFDLLYDATRLTATGISSGGLFDPDTFLVNSAIVAGSASFAEITLAATGLDFLSPLQIATITFQALAAGEVPLTLSGVVLSDSLAGDIPVGLVNASIRVMPSAAPAPGTLLLLSIGAFGLGRARRARTRCGGLGHDAGYLLDGRSLVRAADPTGARP